MHIRRRDFIGGLTALAATMFRVEGFSATEPGHRDFVQGMLFGSLIGDAMGGPVEFLDHQTASQFLANARGWDKDRRLVERDYQQLAQTLPLLPYRQLRPDTAPYGPWKREAPAGTVTDDSRHKIVLMRALRLAAQQGRHSISQRDLAQAFVDFRPIAGESTSSEMDDLVTEGLREYRLASRWILGERDETVALPLERLWAGVSNCSGQMALLPLAALFPGDPESAYRATYDLDFIDAPIARDLCAAINAGLAAVLDPQVDELSPEQRWEKLFAAMRATDPYRLRDVPFAGRQLDRWLDLSDSIVQRSDGRPAVAYRLLETEGKPLYYWDAHFTLLVPLTLLRVCENRPLAAMHLTLDFGHDTDSYAQVLGAMAGAVHGMDIWKEPWHGAVTDRLKADYNESVSEWVETLDHYSGRWEN